MSEVSRSGSTRPAQAHGPLRPLLVGLTVVTGLVDAFSYLSLGHVFVANLTGNVVFLGFGFAGDRNISMAASLSAILAFGFGAFVGGRCAAHPGLHRGYLLAAASGTQSGLVVAASIIAGAVGVGRPAAQLCLVALLGVAMGGQNAVARRLAVPDLTTSVLTLTVTGLVADMSAWSIRRQRLVPVAAMLAGAVAGSALVLRVSTAAPLWLAAALLATCSLIAYASARQPQSQVWR
ncbi:YoaK family protein [Nostocoides sp. HKS02]|uniref:YoaK family protein n=1 Tax=Nostocoides sp. HKS02 TaxID=1813880 RepID=UPI001E3EF9C6|nr:YoaK family protein [Tetrasphaera sp. HKS02]